MRIGKLHPGVFQGLQPGRLALWSRRLLSVVALFAAVAALALIVEDQYGDALFPDQRQAAVPAKAVAVPAGPADVVLSPAEESRYRVLSGFVANRYRVSQEVAYDLVRVAHRTGNQLQLDPLLIIAIIAIESRFNPIAESVAGAKGLMQIIPKYHTDKLQEFGGEDAVYDPAANIQVGARILKEYLRMTGNLGSALQMYNGALADTEDHYSNKVLNEKSRLQQVLLQQRAPAAARPDNRVSAPAPAPVRTASVHPQSPSPLALD